uniref:Uncharacterized protein n=1 Tax=Arundo donax TaxID=35708 RepID=A0A0A9DSE9_ARUDO
MPLFCASFQQKHSQIPPLYQLSCLLSPSASLCQPHSLQEYQNFLVYDLV